jgi:hypothetical protein
VIDHLIATKEGRPVLALSFRCKVPPSKIYQNHPRLVFADAAGTDILVENV